MVGNGAETGNRFQGVSGEILKRVRAQAALIEKRRESDINAFLECIHGKKADECPICKGMTRIGAPMDVVLEVCREKELVGVEIAVIRSTAQGPAILHRRFLKTVMGVGIGAGGFIITLVGWKGGKLIWRLLKKDGGRDGT